MPICHIISTLSHECPAAGIQLQQVVTGYPFDSNISYVDFTHTITPWIVLHSIQLLFITNTLFTSLQISRGIVIYLCFLKGSNLDLVPKVGRFASAMLSCQCSLLHFFKELKQAHFWGADSNQKWAIFCFNLPSDWASHNHVHIAKYLYSIKHE